MGGGGGAAWGAGGGRGCRGKQLPVGRPATTGTSPPGFGSAPGRGLALEPHPRVRPLRVIPQPHERREPQPRNHRIRLRPLDPPTVSHEHLRRDHRRDRAHPPRSHRQWRGLGRYQRRVERGRAATVAPARGNVRWQNRSVVQTHSRQRPAGPARFLSARARYPGFRSDAASARPVGRAGSMPSDPAYKGVPGGQTCLLNPSDAADQ